MIYMNQESNKVQLTPAEICIDNGEYDKAKEILLAEIRVRTPTRHPLNDLEHANTNWLLSKAGEINSLYPENGAAGLFLGRLLHDHASATPKSRLVVGLVFHPKSRSRQYDWLILLSRR